MALRPLKCPSPRRRVAPSGTARRQLGAWGLAPLVPTAPYCALPAWDDQFACLAVLWVMSIHHETGAVLPPALPSRMHDTASPCAARNRQAVCRTRLWLRYR